VPFSWIYLPSNGGGLIYFAPPSCRYYTEADVVALWPRIPRNLTLFSMDDYHPAWMYASSHRCAPDGFPRPPGCANETAGLWVYALLPRALCEPS
jgi:hypothetical protein